jgi:hypothetical protein
MENADDNTTLQCYTLFPIYYFNDQAADSAKI